MELLDFLNFINALMQLFELMDVGGEAELGALMGEDGDQAVREREEAWIRVWVQTRAQVQAAPGAVPWAWAPSPPSYINVQGSIISSSLRDSYSPSESLDTDAYTDSRIGIEESCQGYITAFNRVEDRLINNNGIYSPKESLYYFALRENMYNNWDSKNEVSPFTENTAPVGGFLTEYAEHKEFASSCNWARLLQYNGIEQRESNCFNTLLRESERVREGLSGSPWLNESIGCGTEVYNSALRLWENRRESCIYLYEGSRLGALGGSPYCGNSESLAERLREEIRREVQNSADYTERLALAVYSDRPAAIEGENSKGELYLREDSPHARLNLLSRALEQKNAEGVGSVNVNVDFKAYADIKGDYDAERFSRVFAKYLEEQLRSCAEGIHF